jgi:iron complex transport system substrate-binding protein
VDIKSLFLVLLISFLLALSCAPRGESEKKPSAPIAITDDRGLAVSLDRPAERVVCLSPEAAEIICALGKQEALVGVVRECDYPSNLSQLPQVGSFSSPNLESITALQPDLVVLTGMEQESFGNRLSSWDIPSASFFAHSIEGLYENIRRLGMLLGAESAATQLQNELKKRFKGLEQAGETAVEKYGARRVFVEISPDPIMTVAKGSFVNELIELAGGINVGKDLPREYCRIDPEMVIASDPQVIILLHNLATAQSVSARSGFSEISAVKNGRIITDLNPDIILRASPRLIDGGWELFYAIYPEMKKGE